MTSAISRGSFVFQLTEKNHDLELELLIGNLTRGKDLSLSLHKYMQRFREILYFPEYNLIFYSLSQQQRKKVYGHCYLIIILPGRQIRLQYHQHRGLSPLKRILCLQHQCLLCPPPQQFFSSPYYLSFVNLRIMRKL